MTKYTLRWRQRERGNRPKTRQNHPKSSGGRRHPIYNDGGSKRENPGSENYGTTRYPIGYWGALLGNLWWTWTIASTRCRVCGTSQGSRNQPKSSYYGNMGQVTRFHKITLSFTSCNEKNYGENYSSKNPAPYQRTWFCSM